MFVPEPVRTCVAFIGFNSKKHGCFKLAGTTFFICIDLVGETIVARYAVTARHVIDKIRDLSTDQRVSLRVNLKGASPILIETSCSDWTFHPVNPTVDVAILPFNSFPEELDHGFLRGSAFALGDKLQHAKIGIGEEVFLTGLFTKHGGSKRNIPIVRVGNIAAMPEEPVETAMGEMEAYLIEARSMGGLSGSPVFALTEEPSPASTYSSTNPPAMGAGFYPYSAAITVLPSSSTIKGFCLLGLMHGHFDLPQSVEDSVVDDIKGGSVNMGIGVVVPVSKIWEVLEDTKLQDERNAIVSNFQKTIRATADSLTQPSS